MKQAGRTDWTLISLLLGFLVVVLIYVFEPGGEAVFKMLANIITTVLPFIVVVLGVLLVKKLGTRSLQGKAVLFLTTGMFCYTIGEILWIIYKEVVVSLADIAYLLSYPFWMIGVFYGIRMASPDIFRDKKKIITLILVTIGVAALYMYFFPVSWEADVSLIENLITTGYIIADILLIIPLIFLCYSLITGSLSLGWSLICLGVIATLIADLWYARNYELYEAGYYMIDLVWYLMYFFFIYAFVHFRRVGSGAREKLIKMVKAKKT